MPVISALCAVLMAGGPDVDAVQRAASAAVAQRLEAIGRPMRIDAEPARLLGNAAVEVLDVAVPGPLPRPRVDARVRVRVGGRITTVLVHVDLHDPRDVVTYARSYPRGTPLRDVERVLRTVDLAAVRAPLAAAAPADAVLTHDVEAGEPLLAGDITQAPLVSTGDRVALEASVGRVALVTRGRALESGVRGDRIQVLGDTSSRAVRARILDTGRVSVDE
jgi:flagella basal body P-ring formation protein FlgA